MNSGNQKSTFLRLITVIGFTCVVISWIGFFVSQIIWFFNASKGRSFDHVIGFPIYCAWLTNLICGFLLLKWRKKTGLILMAFGIVFLILTEVLFPEL